MIQSTDNLKYHFSVFDMCQQGWWIPINLMEEYCKILQLDMVPYVGQISIRDAETIVSTGFKTKFPNDSNPDYIEEGIVARPVVPIKSSRGDRIIVKIKHCDYYALHTAITKVGKEEYDKFRLWYFSNQKEIESL